MAFSVHTGQGALRTRVSEAATWARKVTVPILHLFCGLAEELIPRKQFQNHGKTTLKGAAGNLTHPLVSATGELRTHVKNISVVSTVLFL